MNTLIFKARADSEHTHTWWNFSTTISQPYSLTWPRIKLIKALGPDCLPSDAALAFTVWPWASHLTFLSLHWVQFSCVQFFAAPWTAARQASLLSLHYLLYTIGIVTGLGHRVIRRLNELISIKSWKQYLTQEVLDELMNPSVLQWFFKMDLKCNQLINF